MQNTKQLAKVGLLVVMITASIAVPYHMGPVQEARAASGTLLDGYEDGTNENDYDGGVVSSDDVVIKGDYSAYGPTNDKQFPSDTYNPDNLSFWVDVDTSTSNTLTVTTSDSGSATGINTDINRDGNHYIHYSDGSTFLKSDAYVNPNEDNLVRYTNIDYANGEYDIEVLDKDGNVVSSDTGIPFSGTADQFTYVGLSASGDKTIIYDNIGINRPVSTEIDVTSTVSGKIKRPSGDALRNVTVETDTGKSTTTNSSGYYSLSLADGTYEITANKSGYQPATQTVTVSGSDISGVNFTLKGNLSGQITDVRGNPIEGANVSTASGVSRTTNSSGYYDLALTDGDYSVSVETDSYPTKTVDVTVNGSTTKIVQMGRELGFKLEDRSGRFVDGPEMILERPDGTTSVAGFNHNNVSYHRVVDGREYNITIVSDEPAYYTFDVYTVQSTLAQAKLTVPRMDSDGSSDLEANTGADDLEVEYNELEGEVDGSAISMRSAEPVEEVDYTIRNETGEPVYNGTETFDEPTKVWEGRVSDNATGGVSDNSEIDYSGSFDDGSTFDGSANLTGTIDSTGSFGGAFGPTGSSSGGGAASTIGGIGLLAGGVYLAFRAFGNGSLSSVVSSLTRRLP